VTQYRFLFLDQRETVVGTRDREHGSDAAALNEAGTFLGRYASVNVWCDRRMVGRLVQPAVPPRLRTRY
jgi:hypothetical protein